LKSIGADAVTLKQAAGVLEGAYVAAVNELVAASKFPEASDTLEAGLKFDAEFSRLDALRETIRQQQQIAEQTTADERERQRLATAQTHKNAIQSFLSLPTATVDDAKEALAAADQLAAVAPADDLAGSRSHEQIARKLAERAATFGADLDRQIAFLDDALGLIGDSAVLQKARDEARTSQAK